MVKWDCSDRRFNHRHTLPAGRCKAPAVACQGIVIRSSAAKNSSASVAASGRAARITRPPLRGRGRHQPRPAIRNAASAGTSA